MTRTVLPVPPRPTAGHIVHRHVNAHALYSEVGRGRTVGRSSGPPAQDKGDSDRQTFTVVLRPEPGVSAIPALRAALKVLLRRFGLRAISVREQERP